MIKNIGLVWLRDDFRLNKNLALLKLQKIMIKYVVFFLYKKKNLINKRLKNGGFAKSLKFLKKN